MDILFVSAFFIVHVCVCVVMYVTQCVLVRLCDRRWRAYVC